MKSLKIALDWTPNANHIGFYVAQELGLYEEAGIHLEIIDTSTDNYEVTPAKKVELGLVDFALCPLESVMSYQTKAVPFNLQAIAALFKEDLSAIVCKKNQGIESPKDLDGKSYASYKARYEDAIVKQMIMNDGGKGTINVVYPEKLGIWETIENGSIDATWIFMNWEGVQAHQDGLELEYFKMKDYDIPYSYSPVIVVNGDLINRNKETYKTFLKITKMGFLYAQKRPEKAAQMLLLHVPQKDKNLDLKKCIELTTAAIGTDTNWGIMEDERVESFLKWLQINKLENHKLKSEMLYTNILI